MKQIFLEISQAHNLELFTLEANDLYRFSKDEKILTIYQYYFDNNLSGTVQVCRDKEATSLLLTAQGVPNVVHRSFATPLSSTISQKEETSDFLEKILDYSTHFNFKVVCKPLSEANGRDVYFCNTKKDLIYSVSQLMSQKENICISPFFPALLEYRVFMLNGQPELVYKKVRPYIIGNNKDTIYVLFLKKIQKLKNIPVSYFNVDILNNSYIPKKGEIITLMKQHNLSHGAQACFDIPKELICKLHDLGTATAAALNISFCSVDILEAEDGSLKVIEVNPGIRTEILIKQLGIVGYEAAKKLYEKAIVGFFASPQTPC